jgi:hypothetical protein
VAWWAWLLVGWLVLSISCALFLGALAATAREREERRTGTGPPPDRRTLFGRPSPDRRPRRAP